MSFCTLTKSEWQEKAPWVCYDHEVKGVLNGKLLSIFVNMNTVNSMFRLNIKDSAEMDKWLHNVQEPCTDAQEIITDNCQDAETMAISRVGRELYNTIFCPYTHKESGKSPSELDSSVTALIHVETTTTHVIFQTDISSCHLRDIQDGLPHRAANLGNLEYRSIRFERQIFADIGPGYYQSSSVVNYPGLEFNFTRIVEYKHFLNQKSKHTLIVKEFSSDEGDPYYPVPNQRNRELYARYKKLAVKEEKEKGVYFVGRLANYKYFNMDQAIDNALNTFNRIEHSPEQTDLQECWTSGLSAGLISLVFGTNSASQLAANTVTSWLRNFPATNASVHV